jgi:hypothetical protein
MREALSDPGLLGTLLEGESWAAWRALLIGSMGEVLTAEERALWTALTGRELEPGERVEEGWFCVGRRGGKSRAASVLSAYVGGLCDHSDVLAPGEQAVLPVLAQDNRAAGVVLGYAVAAFERSPMLASMVIGRTSEELRLNTGVTIAVRTASWRGLRGLTAVGAICDEIAFWSSDEGSANPDAEILAALRPALATTGGPLWAISSPHARRGELWQTYRRHYGPTGDPRIVVAQAASRTMNPALAQSVVDRAYERDAAVASAEYGGQFRVDIERLLTLEALEACVDLDVRERPPVPGVRYVSFVDPSGGSADSMTLAIAHKDGDAVVIDAVRERKPPFSPADVVAEFAAVLKSYGLRSTVGDRFGGAWVKEAFSAANIEYRPAAKPKSALYGDVVAVVNGGRLRLLDNPRIVAQFVGLERRTARGGRDSIDHAPGQHDDLCNAVAGVAGEALMRPERRLGLAAPQIIDGGFDPELNGDDDLFFGPNAGRPSSLIGVLQ